MEDLMEEIAQADGAAIAEIFQAVLQRYKVLFPEWELTTISLYKKADRNEQLDQIIALLRGLKTLT